MSSVAQVIADPDFAKLSAEDQQGVLSHFDTDFGKVSTAELPGVIQGIQKSSMGRPDLLNPPAVPRPKLEMQTAGLGTDTSTVPNPKTAIAMGGYDPSGFTGEAISATALGGGSLLAAGAAGGAALDATLPQVIPGTIAAAKAIGSWAEANPFKAYLLYKALLEHSAIARFIKGAPGAPGGDTGQ
jgi:hypothetical protein